ncbi:ATP-grasp domain-containing protein [Saccharothrix luteola]|uniref:ATP-grasp domain-containing protein n=1 Tax=Saccharothrix luteola TaxID=2893018 RepID=UPI001E429096|nr:ATP-grasp domain-containing protein [Saccharothrix luteola]MCC8246430.1 ATP-grasp domain-containing protein [Saccharothrix luteola]
MRPKVVLVGQLSYFPPVFDSARRAGIDLILVPRPDDPVTPARLPASVVELLVLPIGADPAAASDLLVERHRREPFDGIMAGNEKVVPFVARAAARLGLVGLTGEAATVVRDKALMRERLRAAGLATPGFAVVAGPDRWRDALRLRFPVVVKPTNGYSSLGVVRVDRPDQLAAAVAEVHALATARLAEGRPAEVLVEEYIDGVELTAESIAHRGTVRVCGVSYKSEMTGPYFEETMMRAPTRLPAEVVAAVEHEVVAAHAAFGVTEGTTHTELRLSADGRPVLLEMAARLGGAGVMHHVIHAATGIDVAAEALRVHLGRPPEYWTSPPAPRGHGAAFSVPVGPGGRVARVRGLDELRDDPRVDHVIGNMVRPGDVLAPYPNWSAYPGIVLSHHASDDDATAFHDHLARTVRVEYEPA